MKFIDSDLFLFIAFFFLPASLAVGYCIRRNVLDWKYRRTFIKTLAKHRGYHGRWKVRLEYNSDTKLFTIFREDEVASIGAVRISNFRWEATEEEEAFAIFENVKDMPQKQIGA
jgi:hypothetical protein